MSRVKGNITQIEAEQRFLSISSTAGIAYNFFFYFQLGDTYYGSMSVDFTTTNNLEHVFLDFTGDEISSLQVNSQPIDLA
jgi:hypothetical protein